MNTTCIRNFGNNTYRFFATCKTVDNRVYSLQLHKFEHDVYHDFYTTKETDKSVTHWTHPMASAKTVAEAVSEHFKITDEKDRHLIRYLLSDVSGAKFNRFDLVPYTGSTMKIAVRILNKLSLELDPPFSKTHARVKKANVLIRENGAMCVMDYESMKILNKDPIVTSFYNSRSFKQLTMKNSISNFSRVLEKLD